MEFCRSTALPHLEGRRSCQENACYRPHSHDVLSIGVIDAGSSVLTTPASDPVQLETGNVIVIPANQVHACNPHEGQWLYQMIHMDQRWAASLAPRREASHFLAEINVFHHPDLHRRVSALNTAIYNDETREQIEAQVKSLLGGLDIASSAYLTTSKTDPELLTRLAPVMVRLRDDDSNPALDDLAKLVGMTKYQLVRAVRRTTGLSPLAWRQNARITQGRHKLREGLPITETAHDLGFTDQSHFHRVFRAHVAASPGTYQG
ncbi:AraC family transcriptional regulator [Kocuria sp. WRN011]|uniref:helix-turn-helix transcriptional regulator n=1 Tax=Kocuria sp. WRN011 TaxID=2029858 RepID=UPI000BAF5BD0|nr:AraC family transcriptional regulator [Kocuria sp. WRN011]PBB09044.1 AraC family transcriptional regulator [Kocuria sp. WRN011]